MPVRKHITNCGNCQFYFHGDQNADPQCRRTPPVPLVRAFKDSNGDLESYVHSVFPEVDQGYWCGEFKSRL